MFPIKHLLSFSLILFCSQAVHSQTWSDDVAEIIYENCTVCHNPNGIGDFSLIKYDEVYNNRTSIKKAVSNKYMPPWIADPSVAHYSGERLLSTSDISKIVDWINQDCPKGNLSNAPPPPIYTNRRYIQKAPDYQVQIPRYKSKATEHSDDYVCFSIPTDLDEEKLIKAIEVIPGNIEIVHHALIFIDPTAESETDTVGGDCGGPSRGNLVTGYVPGSTPTVFPSNQDFNTGVRLPKGSNIILAMHYPEGSFGASDQTTVNFYFYDNPSNFREVASTALIQNWDLNFPPNEKRKIKEVYPEDRGLFTDFTLLSVFPHMHLLGTSIASYFINNNDTTHLISIPEWDFEWQDFYFFNYLQKLPQGSRLYGEATYDNTIDNPNNPNNPPKRVRAGLNTTDEMFLIYYHYMIYAEGDEFINVDSLNQLYLTQTNSFHIANNSIVAYPNPAFDKVTIDYNLHKSGIVSLYIYDTKGHLVKKLIVNETHNSGDYSVTWDIKEMDIKIPQGIYYYSMRVDQELSSGSILIKEY